MCARGVQAERWSGLNADSHIYLCQVEIFAHISARSAYVTVVTRRFLHNLLSTSHVRTEFYEFAYWIKSRRRSFFFYKYYVIVPGCTAYMSISH